MLKNASFLPENATTLGGSGPGKETREPEANTGSAKTAMKGSLKIIGAWGPVEEDSNETGRRVQKPGEIKIFLRT